MLNGDNDTYFLRLLGRFNEIYSMIYAFVH